MPNQEIDKFTKLVYSGAADDRVRKSLRAIKKTEDAEMIAEAMEILKASTRIELLNQEFSQIVDQFYPRRRTPLSLTIQ